MSGDKTAFTVAEEHALTTFMQQLRSVPADAAMQLPEASVFLLKAQLIRRWDAQRRVQRPIDVMEPFEIGAGIAAAVLLLFWSVPSAFEWLPGLMF